VSKARGFQIRMADGPLRDPCAWPGRSLMLNPGLLVCPLFVPTWPAGPQRWLPPVLIPNRFEGLYHRADPPFERRTATAGSQRQRRRKRRYQGDGIHVLELSACWNWTGTNCLLRWGS
jgi:hypothetical protein